MPKGVVAFPGSGITDNLVEKATQLGFPAPPVRGAPLLGGTCAAARMRLGNSPGRGAPCVMNAAADLRQDTRFVTSVPWTTTRNALRCRGPVVSLNRRGGSKPLQRRRFKPVTVCRAALPLSTPIGVDILTPHVAGCRCSPSARLAYFPCAFNDMEHLALAGKNRARSVARSAQIECWNSAAELTPCKPCARPGVSRVPRAYVLVEETSCRTLKLTARGVAICVDGHSGLSTCEASVRAIFRLGYGQTSVELARESYPTSMVPGPRTLARRSWSFANP